MEYVRSRIASYFFIREELGRMGSPDYAVLEQRKENEAEIRMGYYKPQALEYLSPVREMNDPLLSS